MEAQLRDQPAAADGREAVQSDMLPIARERKLSPLPAHPHVLVVGIVPSLTWSVTRSLARANLKPVVLGWHRVSPLQLLPDCQYVAWRNVRWIDDALDPQLVDQIEQACREHGIDVVLPVDYPTVMLLSEHGERIRSSRVAAVPSADTMRLLHNKWSFSRMLDRLGLPQPKTEFAENAAALLNTKLEFPIITKPVDRWASVGFEIHHTRAELERRILENKLAAEFPLLVQDFIPGQDMGFAFVARHGQLVAHAAFEQPTRGVRRYFQSDELRGYVSTLVRETGYHGVGEVDARYDIERKEHRLLEVNPRFWASLLYASHSGMNFPELLIRIDDLVDGYGFRGVTHPVRLAPYELAVARSVLVSEQAYNRWLRFTGS